MRGAAARACGRRSKVAHESFLRAYLLVSVFAATLPTQTLIPRLGYAAAVAKAHRPPRAVRGCPRSAPATHWQVFSRAMLRDDLFGLGGRPRLPPRCVEGTGDVRWEDRGRLADVAMIVTGG